jgi:hypothetical protein
VNVPFVVDVAMEFVTATAAAPAAPPGEVALMCVESVTVTLVAGTPANVTAAPVVVKLVPTIATGVPPAVGPWFGVTDVTVGVAVFEYVNWFPEPVGEVPAGVVTVMLVTPFEPVGETAVIVVALTTDTLVALLRPNFTAVAPVRFVPVSVTCVPPPVGPEFGLTAVTVGVGADTVIVGDVVMFVVPLKPSRDAVVNVCTPVVFGTVTFEPEPAAP